MYNCNAEMGEFNPELNIHNEMFEEMNDLVENDDQIKTVNKMSDIVFIDVKLPGPVIDANISISLYQSLFADNIDSIDDTKISDCFLLSIAFVSNTERLFCNIMFKFDKIVLKAKIFCIILLENYNINIIYNI